MESQGGDRPPDITHAEKDSKPSYANVLMPKRTHTDEWFRLKPVPTTIRPTLYVDNKPACIISNLELDQAAKQFEHALIMKFSSGRPSPHEIKSHVNMHWGLSKEPVISLIDARHIMLITENKDDMVRAQSQVSHRINASLYRIFRWHREYNFIKDSSFVPVWITLPKLPVIFMNPSFLEKMGNLLGNFLSIDENTLTLKNALMARICVEIDVTKDFPREIWIGESKEVGFWQSLEFEGNLAFCCQCGLLEHVRGVCRKLRAHTETKVQKEIPKYQILKKPPTEQWQKKEAPINKSQEQFTQQSLQTKSALVQQAKSGKVVDTPSTNITDIESSRSKNKFEALSNLPGEGSEEEEKDEAGSSPERENNPVKQPKKTIIQGQEQEHGNDFTFHNVGALLDNLIKENQYISSHQFPAKHD